MENILQIVFHLFQVSLAKLPETLPTYGRTMILEAWSPVRTKWSNIFQLISHINFIISVDKISDQLQLSSDFKATWSILVDDKSILVTYLPLKRGFLNFPLFPSFRIGFIPQNGNPETPEIFKPQKTLGYFVNDLKTAPSYARTMTLRVSVPINPKTN